LSYDKTVQHTRRDVAAALDYLAALHDAEEDE
jgi:hypothetical protein